MTTLGGVVTRLLVILAVIWGVGATVVSAQTPPVVPASDINTYIDCLNTIKRGNGTIGDAARCVPQGCYFTVTMSTASAQPACTAGDTKLPRVIFNCTSPTTGLQFEPSFTLCATSSAFEFTELGEEVAVTGRPLKMADVHIPRGADFTSITVDGVLSKVIAGSTAGSKGCNPCHTPAGAEGDAQLSAPIFPAAFFVIDTSMPGQTIGPDGRTTLTEICRSIATSSTIAQNPNVDRQALIYLCETLKAKTLRP